MHCKHYALRTMHFPDLHYHPRGRTRSVHFDRVMSIFSSRESLTGADSLPVRPSSVAALSQPGTRGRSTSLTVTPKENVPSIRRYKSMLDIDEAPKLPAAKPMTYDELYVEPLPEPAPTPATRALEIAKYWKSPHTPCRDASTAALL